MHLVKDGKQPYITKFMNVYFYYCMEEVYTGENGAYIIFAQS